MAVAVGHSDAMDAGALAQIGMAVVLTAMAGALGWLVRTVVANGREVAVLKAAMGKQGGEEAARAEARDAKIQLWCAQRYLTVENYVPQMVLLASKMDALGERLTRIEARVS